MSMKKTDLEKHLAKKLDGRLKSGPVPQRFGKASTAAVPQKPRPASPRLVAVSCRLPAELVQHLGGHAAGREGGLSAVMAEAAEQWLAAQGRAATP